MKKFLTLFVLLMVAMAAVAQTDASLPTGTAVKIKLENTLTTAMSQTGDPFSGRVTEAVMLNGKTVIPIGSTVQGRLSKVSETRRMYGTPTIGLNPEAVVLPNGERYVLNAVLVDTSLKNGTDVNNEGQIKGAGHDSKDLIEIGAGTAGGALIGGLAKGGKGMLVGGMIGGGATVIHWLTKKKSTMVPAGTELVMELSRPMAMTAAAAGGQ